MNSTATDKNASTHTGSSRDEIAAIQTGARVDLNYDPQNSAHNTQTRTGIVTDRAMKKSGDFWKLTLQTDSDERYDVWVNGSAHKRESNDYGYPDDVQKVGENARVEEVQ